MHRWQLQLALGSALALFGAAEMAAAQNRIDGRVDRGVGQALPGLPAERIDRLRPPSSTSRRGVAPGERFGSDIGRFGSNIGGRRGRPASGGVTGTVRGLDRPGN